MTESKEVATKQASPAEVFRGQLEKMEPEFKAALPDHIPVDRFQRVGLTRTRTCLVPTGARCFSPAPRPRKTGSYRTGARPLS